MHSIRWCRSSDFQCNLPLTCSPLAIAELLIKIMIVLFILIELFGLLATTSINISISNQVQNG